MTNFSIAELSNAHHLTQPKLVEYAGFVFPAETNIPQTQKYQKTKHKQSIIAEGQRITTAMARERRYKNSDAVADVGPNVNSLVNKKTCLTNMLFGDVTDDIKAIYTKGCKSPSAT